MFFFWRRYKCTRRAQLKYIFSNPMFYVTFDYNVAMH